MDFNSVVDYAVSFIRLLRVNDVVDICIVAIAVYYFMMATRGTRAVQLIKGVLILVALYMASSILKFYTLNYIMSALVQVAMFGMIVIFQPELRNLLEKMGRLKIGHFLGIVTDPSEQGIDNVIENISRASWNMSQTKTGALIVIERNTRLGEYMHSGTIINALVSSELLGNIFVPNTPLHDGAVIIRGNQIITAGCVLPLTANTNLTSELGTRHRAALGLSEASDAVVVVVSEETGKISLAINGSLTRNLTEQSLKKALTKLLLADSTQEILPVKKIFRKSK